MALSALVLEGPHPGINLVIPSTRLPMLMVCEGRPRKLNDLEGVVACLQVAIVAAAATGPQEVVMGQVRGEEDMAHQEAAEAMAPLQTEGDMGHHHVAMADL